MVDLPRNGFVQPVEGVSGGIPIPVIVTGEPQVQNIETVAALGAGATFAGASRDCINYESFGISVYVKAAAAKTLDTTVTVENSVDGATWRVIDTILLDSATPADSAVLNRVYSVTRQFYRASVTNDDGANALAATELVTMQKPV